jgi:hypothetical protein
MAPSTAYVRKSIPEHEPTHYLAGRLGRHVFHDPRSLDYPFPAQVVSGVKSVRHKRIIAVLNQGGIGACTGNAEEGVLGTLPFFDVIPTHHPRKPTGDPNKDEGQALTLYSEATHLDRFRGVFPPEDTGSNGLAVNKAAKAAGLISGYQHCFSLDAALKALTVQPVIAGINWYSSFDEPDSHGRVQITPDADIRGGHEIALDEIILEERLIGSTNSWGYDWGMDGRFFITWDDFERLMHEQGDVTVPLPLDQAPPVPLSLQENSGCLPKFLQRFVQGL